MGKLLIDFIWGWFMYKAFLTIENLTIEYKIMEMEIVSRLFLTKQYNLLINKIK